MNIDTIYQGHALDVLKTFPDDTIDCVVTSPPFWGLRAYHTEPQIWDDEWRGELGQEPSFKMYVNHLLAIFNEVKRILKPTGCCFVELGDTYASNGTVKTRFWYGSNQGKHQLGNGDGLLSKEYSGRGRTKEISSKSLCNIPHRFAIGMTDHGWIQRNTIIWHKTNCLPHSCKDRFTVDFTYIFFFTKKRKYYFEQQFEPMKDATLKDKRIDQIKKTGKLIYTNIKPNEEKVQSPGAVGERIFKSILRKMEGTLYGGDGMGLHEHFGYYDKDGTHRFYIQGRNKRCVWSLPTKSYPEAHYATYPPDLIKPLIVAGTPQYVCKKCGKARERILKMEGYHFPDKDINDHQVINKVGIGSYKSGSDYAEFRKQHPIENIGMSNCCCNAEYDSGIVLDPFCGSGTTCMVAKQLGRHYVGIELNPKYIEMAERRIANAVYQQEML